MKTTGARTVIAVALLASGCQPAVDSRGYNSCEVTRKECRLYYSFSAGYGRYCSLANSPCPDDSLKKPSGAADAGAPASAQSTSSAPVRANAPDQGAAALPDTRRFSAFDIACTRDSQCGPGKCNAGECFYGCQSDAQCGSGDRCSVESGTRICLPDPNPPVQCTRSAQCAGGMLCLNGSCRQTCSETEECSNLLDRCASGVCQPDRRPLGQCVLNEECPAGSVCLDGSCVDACAGTPDGGVCLAPRGEEGKPAVNQQTPRPALSGVEPRAFPLVDAGPLSRGTDASAPGRVEPLSSAPEPAPSSTPVQPAPVSTAADPAPVSTQSDPPEDDAPLQVEDADAGAPAL
jgi:Cys-rich repeat protein